MKRFGKRVTQLLCCTLCITGTGCSSWNGATSSNKTWNPKTWFKEDFQEPASVATIWKSDVIAPPGEAEQSGFGGRIYFYNERSQAIPVDGDLVVHGYVTTPSSRKQDKVEAEQKFTFSGEQLASQYSPSDLGASYSVWVPWSSEGGYRQEVTLIATFKSKQGTVVQGSPTRLFLPGASPIEGDKSDASAVRPVSYQRQSLPTYDIATPASTSAATSTRITTIEIPRESQLGRHSEGVRVGGGQGAPMNHSSSYPMPSESPSADSSTDDRASGVSVGAGHRLQAANLPSVLPSFEMQTLPPPPATAIHR
ncbi:MAG: hypothetical protein KF752_20790 [Pirellulaceae bacterium]|nr:hypothetical protein [Pirellulaceae bacterium]